ncbi:MAG: hypothetical protein U0174_05540 [Polyangiaceae bacterium]
MRRSSLKSALLGLAFGVACGGSTTKTGGLMVVLSTDVSIPKDIDAIGLYITSGGKLVYGNTEPVHPGGTIRLPATLNVVASDDPRRPVRIRAVGFSKNSARVLRDVTVTIPQDRTAQLRLPLHFLGFGSASGKSPLALTNASLLVPRATVSPLASFDPFTQIANNCGDGKTDVGGTCTSLVIDSSKLEDYEPDSIFGGSAAPTANAAVPGECFPTADCFADGVPLVVDDATCSVAIPTDSGGNFNVALQTDGVGIATNAGTLVVLDQDANAAFGEVGTARIAGGRLALPRGACTKAKVGTPTGERVTGFIGSARCVPKSKKVPQCDIAAATNRPFATSDAGIPESGSSIRAEVVAADLENPRGLTAIADQVYVATKGIKILRLDAGSQTVVHDFGASARPIGLGGGTRAGAPYFGVGAADFAQVLPSDVNAGSVVSPNLLDASALDGVTASGGASYFAVGNAGSGGIALVNATRGTEDPFPIPVENGVSRAVALFSDPAYGLLFVHSGSNALYRCDNPPTNCRNNLVKVLANPKAGGRIRNLAAASDGRLVLAWVPEQADGTGVLYRTTVANLVGTPSTIAEKLDFAGSTGTYGGVLISGNDVYFADGKGLEVVPYAGGTPRLVEAKTKEAVADVVVAGGYLYWLELSSSGTIGTVFRRRLG